MNKYIMAMFILVATGGLMASDFVCDFQLAEEKATFEFYTDNGNYVLKAKNDKGLWLPEIAALFPNETKLPFKTITRMRIETPKSSCKQSSRNNHLIACSEWKSKGGSPTVVFKGIAKNGKEISMTAYLHHFVQNTLDYQITDADDKTTLSTQINWFLIGAGEENHMQFKRLLTNCRKI